MHMKFQRQSIRLEGSRLVVENLGPPAIGRGNYRDCKSAANRSYAQALNKLMKSKREVFEAFVIVSYSTKRSNLNLKDSHEN